MNKLVHQLEQIVIRALIAMMAVVIVLSTVELGWIILKDVVSEPSPLPRIRELLNIFGFFLLILIGVELLETIKAYLSEHVVHVEIVLEVALIAIARKVVILDVETYSSLSLLGIAALILALAVAYYLEKRGRSESRPSGP
ncbi:MAG: phosphate-starvation-inducible PsiE family protein [Planctomycetota bacterium]